MSQLAFDLRHPGEVLNAPRGPSDPELWEAICHPEGYERARTLLERRHGEARAAMVADLEALVPPNPIVHRWGNRVPGVQWAGVIAVLTAETGGGA